MSMDGFYRKQKPEFLLSQRWCDMEMLRIYFGDMTSGRISRLGFLLSFGSALLLFLAISVGLGMSGGIVNHLVVFYPISLVLGFSGLNVSAKRWRDIGLPGWLMVGTITLLVCLVSVIVPGPYEIIFLGLVFAVKLLVPGGQCLSR